MVTILICRIEIVTESSFPRRIISLEQAEDGLLESLSVTDAVASDAKL